MILLVLSLQVELISLCFCFPNSLFYHFSLASKRKSWRKNQFFLLISCYNKVYCNREIVQNPTEVKNRCSRDLGKKLMRDCNESLWVCSFSVESLFRETVKHIFQTIFQIIFPSVLTRNLHFCSKMSMSFKKHSLQYPLSLCLLFPWPISWLMVCVVQRGKIRNSLVSSYSPNTVCTFMCGLLLVRYNA